MTDSQVNRISSDTGVYAVIGNPVGHSLSPVMHNRAFGHIGFNGVYLAFQVEAIEAAITGIRGLGIRGVSVTIPHKVSVMRFLDQIEDRAKKIGAVNTLVNQNGRLKGFNTDCIGAVKALTEKTTITGKRILIIGAGGAARAIGFGVASEGGRIFILNRTEEKGKALADDLGGEFVSPSDVSKTDAQIVINTTSVGMKPNVDESPINPEILNKEMVVMDIIYNPITTRLLKAATDIGCTIVGGVSMFVYQGASQFELWTAQKAPIEVMKQAVIAALNQKMS